MKVVDNLVATVASESRPQNIYEFEEKFQMKMNLG